MKLAIIILSLAAFGSADLLNNILSSNTAYGYLTKYGIPEAERIKKAEEEYLRNKSIISRIAGGSPAALGQFKYQAGLISDILGSSGKGVCGGSLLTTNRVLTAAHCWDDGRNKAWRFTIVLGSETLFTGGTRIRTSDVVTHPLWHPAFMHNDVAMIRLPEHVVLSDTIGTVSLPSGYEVFDDFTGQVVTAAGYGLTNDVDTINNNQFLNFVNMTVISNEICNVAFFGNIQPSNICTNTLGGNSTCRGDSGGPLVVQRGDRTVLVGVTSLSNFLGCEFGYPVVFSRVTSFLGFINSNM
ncbi:unnamed protein product [Danaus chrysippus]|uniref:(African queen) hypothetical protein n=1 Tax=Danaus chrysippus TaxID=151541 RepID=A0A8J2R698_9NEOP|nr:unnamed protein product [Danaus chrysippus]